MKAKKKSPKATAGSTAQTTPGTGSSLQPYGNQSAQQALPRYMPGQNPDGGLLSKVTDDMRLNSLAQVLGGMAGRQAALKKKASDLQGWLSANKLTKSQVAHMKEQEHYKGLLADIDLQLLSLKSQEAQESIKALKTKDAALSASLNALSQKIYAIHTAIMAIDKQLDILVANQDTLKEQQETSQLNALASQLGQLAGQSAALQGQISAHHARTWALLGKGPPPLPSSGGQPASNAPSRDGATTLLQAQ
jgi:chromosome segregation ATPase